MANTLTTDRVASDMINMMVKQLGATNVKNMPAHINIYEFVINDDICWISDVTMLCTCAG